MKIFKTFLLTLCASLFALCLGLTACEGDNDAPPPVRYSVTVQCDAEKGSIGLSPASADGKYAKDTPVMATVTAKADYEIAGFTVNGEEADLTAQNTYTFTVTEDTVLAATFTQTATSSDVTVTLDFNAAQGSIELTPASADGKYAKGTSITATVTAAANYEIESFTVNGTEEDLTAQNTYTFTADENTALAATFAEQRVTAALPDSYNGTYYRLTADNVITVGADGFKIDGTACTVTKTAVSNVYYAEWNNVSYIISLNTDNGIIPVLRLTSTADSGRTEINFYLNNVATAEGIEEEWQGNWRDEVNGVDLVIGAKSVTWNSEEAEVIGIGKNNIYYPDILFRLEDGKFVELVGNFENKLKDLSSKYEFVKQNSAGEAIPIYMQGKYTDNDTGTEYTLIIEADSITFNSVTATEYSVSAEGAIKTITFVAGGKNYTFTYADDGINNTLEGNEFRDGFIYMTKQEGTTQGGEAIPLDWQGTYKGSKEIEYTLVLGANSVTLNNEVATEYTVSAEGILKTITFVVGGKSYTFYFDDSGNDYHSLDGGDLTASCDMHKQDA